MYEHCRLSHATTECARRPYTAPPLSRDNSSPSDIRSREPTGRRTDLSQFVVFLDRRVWSSGTLIVEAGSLEEAWQLYQDGRLDDCLEAVARDDDDIEVTLVD